MHTVQIYSELIAAIFWMEQECVPVILSDQVELPFQNVVDYAQISIKWPSTRIGKELLDYLESIPGHILVLHPAALFLTGATVNNV